MPLRWPFFSTVVPTLTICGQKDSVANAKKYGWSIYHKTTAPRMIMEVKGGDHYLAHGPAGGTETEATTGAELSFLNYFCAMFCDCAPIKGESGIEHVPCGHARDTSPRGAIGGLALAWVQLVLVGDETARAKLLAGPPGIASGFELDLEAK